MRAKKRRNVTRDQKARTGECLPRHPNKSRNVILATHSPPYSLSPVKQRSLALPEWGFAPGLASPPPNPPRSRSRTG